MRSELCLNNQPDLLGLTLEDAALILDKSGCRRVVKKTTPPFSKNLSNNYRVIRLNMITRDVVELVVAAENLAGICIDTE